MSEENTKASSDRPMPRIGFGTGSLGPLGQVPDNVVLATVKEALRTGYRHLDTAAWYRNEHLVGQAVQEWAKEGNHGRDDVFIATKLPPIGLRPADVGTWMQRSLKNLGMTYVDLYYIHFPVAMMAPEDGSVSMKLDKDGNVMYDHSSKLEDVWLAMEEQVKAGRTRAIGISNFNCDQIKRILKVCNIAPKVLQVEVNAYFQQRPLRAFCRDKGITVAAYAPLATPGNIYNPDLPTLVKDSAVVKIAERLGKTSGQVLLRYLLQEGVVPIPKSGNKDRMASNFEVFNFELTENDMKELHSLARGPESRIYKMNTSFKNCDKQPEYPFSTPF